MTELGSEAWNERRPARSCRRAKLSAEAASRRQAGASSALCYADECTVITCSGAGAGATIAGSSYQGCRVEPASKYGLLSCYSMDGGSLVVPDAAALRDGLACRCQLAVRKK